MKSAVVSIGEIQKGNPRLCLSALRYTGNCFKCPEYRKPIIRQGKKTGEFRYCESRIETETSQQFKELTEKKKQLNREIEAVDKAISEL